MPSKSPSSNAFAAVEVDVTLSETPFASLYAPLLCPFTLAFACVAAMSGWVIALASDCVSSKAEKESIILIFLSQVLYNLRLILLTFGNIVKRGHSGACSQRGSCFRAVPKIANR